MQLSSTAQNRRFETPQRTTHGLPDGVDMIAQVARLYLVVHGRPPDRGGLESYVQHMRDGKTLRQLASEFVASDEFIGRVGDKDPSRVIGQNAFGSDGPPADFVCEADGLDALVASLVLSPQVQQRLPLLPALYPEGVPLESPADYRIWLAARASRENAPPRDVPLQVGAAPVVSFIVLLRQPNATWLAALMASVLDQNFPHVELVIVSDGIFPKVVRQRAATDKRLRLVRAAPWARVASRFNRAIGRCKGAFVSVIGQHDRLCHTALSEMVGAAENADIVLTDDDALDAEGLRHSPRLGTAWDPDRVLASGCPGLILIKAALARRIGGMRPTHGLEEWDMLLRAAATKEGVRVTHLPSILLSRRSAAVMHGSHATHRMAAHRYLCAIGHGDAVVQSHAGTLRVIYPLSAKPPLASIIIPTRDRADLLQRCVASLLQRTDYRDVEILIIDNGSVDTEAIALLQDLSLDPRVRVFSRPGPFNWSALNNFGVAQMRGDIAVLLNNDTDVLEPSWLRELVSQALRPEVGVVGAKLLYADGRVQHAGVVLGPAGRATHMWRTAPGDARGYLDQLISTRQVTVVTGACLAIRREVYLAVGGCDAERLPITWNDSDLCLRIRAQGYRAIWCPHVRLLHLEQATRGSDDAPERQERFARERAWMRARWNGALDADPFLNAQLLPSEAHAQPRLAVE